ncbi:MAG TPA: hypothetical protein DCG06_08440 [Deltaproteobacteria bacterium]|nr:hypothetical protein [Deltaproteobacteria bacterium]
MKDLPQETRRSINVATVASAAMIAQQIAGKAERDGLFLVNFPATELPKAMIAGALLSFVGALILSSVLSRFGPRKTAPGLFSVSAVIFLGFAALYQRAPALITVLLYLHMASFGILVISAFWSLINELFDPHTAKIAIARIVTGSTFGGVCGGILADRLTELDGPTGMFLMLSGLHALCALILSRMNGPDIGDRQRAGVLHGLAVIRRSSYLKQIALSVALASGVAALLDYTMKAEAAKHYLDEDSLVSFFAAFYTGTSVLAFFLQRLLADTTLRRIGLSATMSILPIAAMAGSLLGAAFTRLPTLVAAKGVEVILANSLFRSGIEMTYTPVPPNRKRAAKSIVDVVAQRTGDLVGGGLILLILAITPLLTQEIVLTSAALVAAISVAVIARLKRGYVVQLTESLKRGLLAEATNKPNPSKPADKPPEHTYPAVVSAEDSPPLGDLIETMQALISDDPMQQRRALTAPNIDPRVASLITPLLADERLKKTAAAALETLGDRINGQLADALMDATQPDAVRTQLPSLIESLGGARSANALLLALEGTPFPVRYACGQALARLTEREPSLTPAPTRVFALAAAEIHRASDTHLENPPGGLPDGAGLFEDDLAERAGPKVEHLFNLLALVLDREAVAIALRGWLSDDRRMRGTAIEYFENVLPEQLRRALAEYLPQATRPAGTDSGK